MGASTLLEQPELSVVPGSDVTTVLRVRNTGTTVDSFTFQPLGSAAGWMTIDPPQLSMLPGTEESVTITFRPPRVASTLAGTEPWAVRALSSEDPDGSVVDEGAVTVEPFSERNVELLPRNSRARRTGRHELAFDNRGNAPVRARLSGTDPEGDVTLSFRPPQLETPPGSAQFVKVRVRPRRTFWKGAPQAHPFSIVLEEEGQEPLATDGMMLQEPLLPPWFWKAVLAAAALLLVLFILWQTLFKSTIESTATNAVEADVEQAQIAAVQAEEAAEVAQEAAGITPTTTVAGDEAGEDGAIDEEGEDAATDEEGQAGEGEGGPDGGEAGGADGGGSFRSALGTPLDFRLVVSAAPGSGATSVERAIDPASEISLTDVVLQNPNGDTGSLVVLRNDEVLWETALQNFRDLDYHFVAPYGFAPGDRVILQVTCLTAGEGPTCEAAASFTGFIRDA